LIIITAIAATIVYRRFIRHAELLRFADAAASRCRLMMPLLAPPLRLPLFF